MARVFIYDTTLRDGTQGEHFQLSVDEKLRVAHLLDELGVAYIEGGWPGSNPRDEEFFRAARGESFRTARLAAFGSTRRYGITCDEDASVQELVRAEVPVVTIFGKSSVFQATEVLRIEPEQNLELIVDTVRYLKSRTDEVIYDAEHFFDAYKEDAEYAMRSLVSAVDGGADWLTLCDTNGGSLPDEVAEIVAAVTERFDARVGIHTHNDCELAVANSLAAVRAGARLVQGTVNGFGERCGNANLISIIPSLELKMGHECLPDDGLKRITHLSRTVDEISNNIPIDRQAYVGRSAFAHKGGVHVNAVLKNPRSYEHVEPESVGNERRVLVSDLSGGSNIAYIAKRFGLDLDAKSPWTRKVLSRIKRMENEGYQFEGADASLRLLIEEARAQRPLFFEVERATVNTLLDDSGDDSQSSKATVRLLFDGEPREASAAGNGPVNALANAFQKLLDRAYPELEGVHLVDYKVRILSSGSGTASVVRVLIRASDGEESWGTVGVSTNVVEASWRALVDMVEYKLMLSGVAGLPRSAAE